MTIVSVLTTKRPDWTGFAWQIAGVLGLAGLVVFVGGTIWAMILGLPAPFILMTGFCTLVSAIWFALLPVAYQTLVKAPLDAISPALNYKAFRLQHRYTLGGASRLWMGLPPNVLYANSETNAWYETFVSAIHQRKLRFIPSSSHREYEQQHPNHSTVVSRDEFKRYAASINEDPLFLRDG